MQVALWQSSSKNFKRELMMSLRKASVAAIAALALTSTPVLAATSSLSVASAQARAGAPLEEGSELGGGFLIPLLALAAIVAGILVVVDGDDDEPVSP